MIRQKTGGNSSFFSYFPITAYLADSGHFLRLDNRPGNVRDGAASGDFLKTVFAQVKDTLGRDNKLRLRMDGAFLNKDVLDGDCASNSFIAPDAWCGPGDGPSCGSTPRPPGAGSVQA